MSSNGISIVRRAYFQDGDRLYPDKGYDFIDPLSDALLPGVFHVGDGRNEGLVNERNEELFSLQFCHISKHVERVGDNVYTLVRSGFKHRFGILQLSKIDEQWAAKIVLLCNYRNIATIDSADQNGWLRVVAEDGTTEYFNLFSHEVRKV